MKTSVIQGFSILLVLYTPAAVLAGQALVALHRRNDNLDAVASRASKNVAVRGLCRVNTSCDSRFFCLALSMVARRMTDRQPSVWLEAHMHSLCLLIGSHILPLRGLGQLINTL